MKYIIPFFLLILFSQIETLCSGVALIGKQGEKLFGFGRLGDIDVSPAMM